MGDIGGSHNLVGDAVDFLFLVPGTIGIELHVQGGSQHLGCEFFSIISSGVLGFAEGVMFAQIAVSITIGRDSYAYARGQQAVRLVSRVFRHYGKDDLTRVQKLQSLGARDQFALWRENRRDANQILGSDTGVTQRQLKRCKTFPVFADPLGEKDSLGDHVLAQFVCPPVALVSEGQI